MNGKGSAVVHKSWLQHCVMSGAKDDTFATLPGFAHRNVHDGSCQDDTNLSAGMDDQEEEPSGSDVYQQAESSRQPSVTTRESRQGSVPCHATKQLLKQDQARLLRLAHV